jgi:MFS family permease
MSGYLTVAVAYLLTQAGVSVEQVAELVAISFIPQTWKFMWAPLADTTLTRKSWYLIAAVISAVGIYATVAVPADGKFMPLLYVVVVISNTAVTFLAMSVESLMVYGTPAAEKGRASGWFQAGNLGGPGGAGLLMAQERRRLGSQVPCSASPACCVASRSCSLQNRPRCFAAANSGAISSWCSRICGWSRARDPVFSRC